MALDERVVGRCLARPARATLEPGHERRVVATGDRTELGRIYLLVYRTLTAPVRSIGWTSNPWVIGGIGMLLVLQAGFVHLPLLQTLFRTADLTVADWLLAMAAGATVIPVASAEKAWRRRSSARGRVPVIVAQDGRVDAPR